MARWIDALARTRRQFAVRVNRVLSRAKALDTQSIEELEQALLLADVSPRLALDWTARMRDAGGDPRDVLRGLLLAELTGHAPIEWRGREKPCTLLVVGVNGSGKTTTCAKLGHMLSRTGLKPLLAAADTFRAAGAEQLQMWADRLGVEAVSGAPGADAAAVAYDALDAAVARGADFLIVDTAGRMHTRRPLMDELAKLRRSLAKRVAHAPDETWVVLDAAMGQNAIVQARMFHDAVPLTGAVIAKLDGSAKAGFVFSVRRELGIPIRMTGIGESAEDLVPFDPEAFVDALLDTSDAVTAGVGA